MTERQVGNLRTGTPLSFGSKDDARAWEIEAEKLRTKMTAEFCVGPRIKLRVARGLLEPEVEVRREDIVGVDGLHDHRRWRDLLGTGRVIARDG